MAGTVKAFVVDDEPDMRTLLRLTLELSGYEVKEAGSGEECLKALDAKYIPDIILLDVMMPGINGYDVCRNIRKNMNYKKTKIVLVTAKALKSDEAEGLGAGADAYFVKPFNPYDLREKISGILGK